MKPWVCRLLSVLCAVLSWALGLSLARSTSWRLWEFRSDSVPFVSIGLWAAVYYQQVNVSGALRTVPTRSRIDSSWVLPAEMEYSRDLLFFANFAKAVAMLLGAAAALLGWTRPGSRELPTLGSKAAATFLTLSSCCTVTTVTWNAAADQRGHSTLDFPLHFPVARENLVRVHSTYVLPLGLATAALSLASTLLFLGEACLAQRRNRVAPGADDLG